MTKIVEVELQVGSKQALGSINDLKQAAVELESALEGQQIGSSEFNRLSSQLKNVRNQLKDLDSQLEGLDKEQRAAALVDSFNGLTGAVQAVSSAFIAFGADSTEIEQAEKKLLGVIGVVGGLREASNGLVAANKLLGPQFSAIGDSIKTAFTTGTIAARTFKIALASIGIGALIAGVGFLIEKFISTESSAKDAASGLDEFRLAQERLDKAVQEGEELQSRLFLSQKGRREFIKNQIADLNTGIATGVFEGKILLEEEIENLKKRKQLLNIELAEIDQKAEEDAQNQRKANSQKRIADQIALNEKLLAISSQYRDKLTNQAELEITELAFFYDEVLKEFQNLTAEQFLGLIQKDSLSDFFNRSITQIKDRYKQIEDIKKQFDLNTIQGITELANTEIARLKINAFEQVRIIEDLQIKRLQSYQKDLQNVNLTAEQRKKIEEERDNFLLQSQVRKKQIIDNTAKDVLAIETTSAKDIVELQKQAAATVIDITNKVVQSNIDARKKDSDDAKATLQKNLTLYKEYGQSILQFAQILVNGQRDIRLQELQENFNINRARLQQEGATQEQLAELEKQYWEKRQKYLINSATSTAIFSTLQAFASQLTPGDPSSLGRAAIAAAVAAATGATQIALLKKQTYEGQTGGFGGGTSGGIGSINNIAGGQQTSGVVLAPRISPSGQTGQDMGGMGLTSSNGVTPVFRTYVLSGDITDAQIADAKLNQKRKL
jgi:hypothetical protein